MNPEYKQLMEIAGTLENHIKQESKLFNQKICPALDELVKFCNKQHESKVYGPISKEALDLCKKLKKHLTRYK